MADICKKCIHCKFVAHIDRCYAADVKTGRVCPIACCIKRVASRCTQFKRRESLMNTETKAILGEIYKTKEMWEKVVRQLYKNLPECISFPADNVRLNLILKLKENTFWIRNSTTSDVRRNLLQSAMAHVDWRELADYLLEDIDSVVIEDWPKYTWGIVVKGSDHELIQVGDKISIFNGKVTIAMLDGSNFYAPINKCKGARVKELDDEC